MAAAAAAIGAAALGLPVLLVGAPSAEAATSTPLVGTFTITPGSCSGATVSGSYIRMILPSGSTSGPYMSNSDSACSDQSYTLVAAGTDGGLVTGEYQPNPSPAFSSSGSAAADRITAPSNYYGTSFATSTNPVDPQTGLSVPAPSLSVSDGTISGQLKAFSVAWNNQFFNQGAPKPDGTDPGITQGPSGTYNAANGDYTLGWTSEVVGGPFNSFTGQWHLTGRFIPRNGSSPPGTSAGSPTTVGRSAGGTTASSGRGSSGPTASAGATKAGSSSSPAKGNSKSTGPKGKSPSLAGTGSTSPSSSSASGPSHTTVSRHGWRTPSWLVALATALGVAGIVGMLLLRSRLRLAPTAAVALALATLTVTSLLQVTVTDHTVVPLASPGSSNNGAASTSPGSGDGSGPVATGPLVGTPADSVPIVTGVPVPAGSVIPVSTVTTPPTSSGAGSAPGHGTSPSKPTGPSTTLPPPVEPVACPLGLPAPAQTGGLQSLIGLEPLFGPFTAEAFAMGSAYAPILELMGPVLAQYPSLSTQLAPVLVPLLSDWETLADAGGKALLPIYDPVRKQMLGYETQFAAAIAPLSEAAAKSAPAACVIDLEGELLKASKA